MTNFNIDDTPDFYKGYLSYLPVNDAISILEKQLEEMIELFNKIGEQKSNYAYAEGKWTIKQVIGHINDTERIFSIRALCFARSEVQKLPGFNQDNYVNEANFNDQPFDLLTDQFILERQSNIALFKSFTEEMKKKKGTADNSEISVYAIMLIMAGHVYHHKKIIEEKYLG